MGGAKHIYHGTKTSITWYQDQSVRLHTRDPAQVQEQVPFSGDDHLKTTAPFLKLTQLCAVLFLNYCLQDFIDFVYLLNFACIVSRSDQMMFAASSTVFGTLGLQSFLQYLKFSV